MSQTPVFDWHHLNSPLVIPGNTLLSSAVIWDGQPWQASWVIHEHLEIYRVAVCELPWAVSNIFDSIVSLSSFNSFCCCLWLNHQISTHLFRTSLSLFLYVNGKLHRLESHSDLLLENERVTAKICPGKWWLMLSRVMDKRVSKCQNMTWHGWSPRYHTAEDKEDRNRVLWHLLDFVGIWNIPLSPRFLLLWLHTPL